MKFCPECGKRKENDICTCGYDFVKNEKSKVANNHNLNLFTEQEKKEPKIMGISDAVEAAKKNLKDKHFIA